MNRIEENEDYLLFDDGRKKNEGGLGLNDTQGSADKEYLDGLVSEVKLSGEQMDKSRRRLDAWANYDWDNYYKERQKSFLVPKDTEERRRLQFVTAPKVVDEAIDEYYNTTFRPKMQAERKAADDRAFEAYKSYATVPGADPSAALGSMYVESNPLSTLNKVMETPDDGALDSIANRYAGYAGLDPSEYRTKILEPALRQRAIQEIVDEKTPNSSAEYILREAKRNSLAGSLSDLNLYGRPGAEGHRYIDDFAMENYNPSRVERFTAGVGGLFMDSSLFAGIGTAASALTGKVTNAVVNRAVSKMLAEGASKGITREIAENAAKKAVLGSLKTKIAQSAMNQGITLGVYDAAHSVVDDILHGEDIDVGAAAAAFGRGAATGSAVGVVGTPLRHAARGLTGGRRLASSAGILSAESAVFTASGEIGKIAEGVEVEPIDLVNDFGESAATLLAMRMLHWRPSGAQQKLNTLGHLRERFRFSKPEAEEIRRAGVDPEQFIANIEKSLNIYEIGSGKAARDVKMDYLKLMSQSGLSASARSKLLYIVENKLSSTPPEAVDYKVREKEDGSYVFSTIDAEGRLLENIKCRSREELKSLYFTRTGRMRRNRIAMHENMLMQSYDSQNFFRQAGKYSRETGVDAESISDIMYRKARQEQLSPEEQSVLDEIMRRSNYADNEVGQMLHSIRRNLEQKYGLNEGSLLGAVEKSSFNCSAAENEALNDYECIMREEVQKLHEGTSNERANELSSYQNEYTGLGNEELKELEKQNFKVRAIETGVGMNKGSIPTFTEKYGIFASDIRKPSNWNDHYVWNPRMNMHTKESVDMLAQEALKIGESLGTKVKVILDESEIKPSEPGYASKVRSYGWLDESNGNVVINIPNNRDIDEVRKTVVHEVVGHRGLGQLFGFYYIDFLEEVYARGTDKLRKDIDELALNKGLKLHSAVDEYLATLTEKTVDTPAKRTLYQRFRDFVREMLQRFNFYREPIGEDELLVLLQRHRDALSKKRKYTFYRSSAFRPYATAGRIDGGYFNYDRSKNRYVRDMKKNPQMNGLHPGFHELRRELYDLQPGIHYRDIGDVGMENLRYIPYYNNEQLEGFKISGKDGSNSNSLHTFYDWSKTPEGKWIKTVSNTPSDTEFYDYVYRTLRLHNPNDAETYKRVVAKPKERRSLRDVEFLEHIYRTTTEYDNTARVNDIIYDWKLFTAYPQIADIPVVFANLKDRNVLYDVQNKRLILDKHGFSDPTFKNEIYYAMQHVIDDIEGFGQRPVSSSNADIGLNRDYNDGMFVSKLLNKVDHKNIFPLAGENFRMRYGADIENFREKYPSREVYMWKNANKIWPDDYGREMRSYSTTTEELKGFLGGPIDVIENVLNNTPHNENETTLREAERENNITTDVPTYTVPKYIRKVIDYGREGSLDDESSDKEFVKVYKIKELRKKLKKELKEKEAAIKAKKAGVTPRKSQAPMRSAEEILKEFNEKYGKK